MDNQIQEKKNDSKNHHHHQIENSNCDSELSLIGSICNTMIDDNNIKLPPIYSSDYFIQDFFDSSSSSTFIKNLTKRNTKMMMMPKHRSRRRQRQQLCSGPDVNFVDHKRFRFIYKQKTLSLPYSYLSYSSSLLFLLFSLLLSQIIIDPWCQSFIVVDAYDGNSVNSGHYPNPVNHHERHSENFLIAPISSSSSSSLSSELELPPPTHQHHPNYNRHHHHQWIQQNEMDKRDLNYEQQRKQQQDDEKMNKKLNNHNQNRELRDQHHHHPDSQQHPLLSIINFSSSSSSSPMQSTGPNHSNANEFLSSSSSFPTTTSSWSSPLTPPPTLTIKKQQQSSSSSSSIKQELNYHRNPINLNDKNGDRQNFNESSSSSSFMVVNGDNVDDQQKISGQHPKQKQSDPVIIKQYSPSNNHGAYSDASGIQRTPRYRDSKLGHDFLMAASNNNNNNQNPGVSGDLPPTPLPTMISTRPNSKDLSRNLPNSVESVAPSSGSSMNDLLGGLAQLLGGNMKLPSNNNGANNGGGLQLPPFAPEQQNKLANLLAQMTGGGASNLGLNQRIPPHLTHLIPRGPNGSPLLPNFGIGPPSSPNGVPLQPPKIQNIPPRGPPIAPHHPSSFQLPFIPLMASSSGGNGGRPAAIPLNNNNNHNKPQPPMHGLTKAEMDALFHQFVSGHGQNKTQNLISNLMSKLSGDQQQSSPPKMNNINNELVPFNLNDTSRLMIIQPSHTNPSLEPPSIITMQEEGPSVFEMVVKHKIGPSAAAESSSSKPQSVIKQTSPIQPIQRLSTSTSTSSSSIISSTTSTNQLIQPSIHQSKTTEIRNQHHHPTQILKVTAPNPNQLGNGLSTTATNNHHDVVYGKRIAATTTTAAIKPTPPLTTITTTSTINSNMIELQSSFSKKFLQPVQQQQSTTTMMTTETMMTSETPKLSSAIPNSGVVSSVSFGKPVVMQLPIENVKPKIGQFDPSTPAINMLDGTRSFSTSNSKGGFVENKSNTNVNNINNKQQQPQINSASVNSSYSISKPKSQAKPYVRRPSFRPRPNVPIVRIDTCIVGDDSTCDITLNEKCITELGLSSCQCRPGFARTIPRTSCVPVISLALSFRVDKMAGQKVQFTRALLNSNSEEYQYLEYESMHALNSMFSQTKTLNSDLMAVKINRFYAVGGRTVVNATISLRSNDTSINSHRIKRTIQQELTQVIIESNSQLGESQLSVDSSSNAITRIDDLNECSSPEHNDCSKNAVCINEFGGFRCECEPGYEDKYAEDRWQSGRQCSSCSPQYCSNRGECLIVKGEKVCRCRANFIGSQCDIDAEVLGVAIGGSIAALVIIVITFICLYMWNQRFRQEQAKIEAMSAASGHTFSYMFNKPATAASMAHHHATLSRMSIDERYGIGGITGNNRGSWTINGHGGHYSDSHQHLLSTTNGSSSGGGGGGYYNPAMANSDHQNASHVYAQPVRVVPAGGGGGHGSSDYDPSGGYHHHQDVWSSRARSSLHSKKPISSSSRHLNDATTTARTNGTISGSGIHYPYKHDTYNETEFSTRELIYSPAHLYATNPRQSNHGYY